MAVRAAGSASSARFCQLQPGGAIVHCHRSERTGKHSGARGEVWCPRQSPLSPRAPKRSIPRSDPTGPHLDSRFKTGNLSFLPSGTPDCGRSAHKKHSTKGQSLKRRPKAKPLSLAFGPRYSLATSGTENGPGSIPEFNLATAGTPTVGFGHEAYENTQLQRSIWKAILLQLLSRQKVSRELGQCSTLGSRLPPSGKAT